MARHSCTWVLGDDPTAQVEAALGPDLFLWSAIGGEFTGRLYVRPGAQGRVFGYAVPKAEMDVFLAVSEDPKLNVTTGFKPGPAFDQARLGDVDLEKTAANFQFDMVVIEHEVYRCEDEDREGIGELKFRRSLEFLVKLGGKSKPPTSEELALVERGMRAYDRWATRMLELISAQNPDSTMSIVDVAHV